MKDRIILKGNIFNWRDSRIYGVVIGGLLGAILLGYQSLSKSDPIELFFLWFLVVPFLGLIVLFLVSELNYFVIKNDVFIVCNFFNREKKRLVLNSISNVNLYGSLKSSDSTINSIEFFKRNNTETVLKVKTVMLTTSDWERLISVLEEKGIKYSDSQNTFFK